MQLERIILELIKEYIACSKYSCGILEEQYEGNEHLLRAKVLKLIQKEGHIDGLHYYFHGRGCLFEYENDAIDVDFGPEGRCDGFDSYRLKKFLDFRKDRFKELLIETEFDYAFKELIKNKTIRKHPLEPADHLYYLSDSL